MTVYADEEFYNNEYLCGKEAVIDTAFDFYARKATQKIKEFILDNADEDDIPECVRMCCCEIAELIFSAENVNASTSGAAVLSESVGDYSVSYENAENQNRNLKNNIRAAIYSWLAGTGLLYTGVKGNAH